MRHIPSTIPSQGYVTIGRLNATLAVSRAFGDAALKTPGQPVLLCDPEITACVLQPDDQFVLIACDGLFDVMSSNEATAYIFDRLLSEDPESIVQNLVHRAVDELKSMDNVSAMLALINPLRTIHESRLPPEHRINLIPTLAPGEIIDDTTPLQRQRSRYDADDDRNAVPGMIYDRYTPHICVCEANGADCLKSYTGDYGALPIPLPTPIEPASTNTQDEDDIVARVLDDSNFT